VNIGSYAANAQITDQITDTAMANGKVTEKQWTEEEERLRSEKVNLSIELS